MKRLKFLSVLLIIAASFAACDKGRFQTLVLEEQSSDAGITAIFYQGNISCDDLVGGPYIETSGRINYEEGQFDNNDIWPFDLEVTVTDGKYVSFSLPATSQYCVGAVIVKGGNGANIYYYDSGNKGDEGLTSPINASGNPADLSNLTFCFVECDEPLVIAVKALFDDIDGNRKYCLSSGTEVFVNTRWCGTWGFGVNPYPRTSSFDLHLPYSDTKVGVVTVDINGDVTLTLNEGLKFYTTWLYVGTLDDLLYNNLDITPYSDQACPLYKNTPPWYMDDTYSNTHFFDF